MYRCLSNAAPGRKLLLAGLSVYHSNSHTRFVARQVNSVGSYPFRFSVLLLKSQGAILMRPLLLLVGSSANYRVLMSHLQKCVSLLATRRGGDERRMTFTRCLNHSGETRFSRSYRRIKWGRRGHSTISMGAEKVDVDRVRQDMLDSGGIVHLNSAGDSPMPKMVLDRITEHLRTEALVGGYEAAARCQGELQAVYDSAALLINAHPDEIALQVRCHMSTVSEHVPLQLRAWLESS